MIKNKKIFEKFERNLIKNTQLNYRQNRKIFEGMYKQAMRLKVLPRKNKLEGIEVKIKIAKVINSVR